MGSFFLALAITDNSYDYRLIYERKTLLNEQILMRVMNFAYAQSRLPIIAVCYAQYILLIFKKYTKGLPKF